MKQTDPSQGRDSPLQQRLEAAQAQLHTLPWRRGHEETPILRAWERCRAAGLKSDDKVSFEPVSRSMLSTLDDAHHELIAHARKSIDLLRDSLAATGCIVILTNQRGVVIDRFGRTDQASVALAAVSRKGTNLDERSIGSSAPSIALAERQSSLVLGDAHFCSNMRKFYCAAAPIEGHDGQLLGVLDISSYDVMPRFDILSLAEDAATAIENAYIEPGAESVVLRFQVLPEWIDTPRQAIVAVRSDGRITGANRIASSILGLTRRDLRATTFRALFDRDPSRLFARARASTEMVEWITTDGLRVFGRLVAANDAPGRTSSDARRNAMLVLTSNATGVNPEAFGNEPSNLKALARSAIQATVDRFGGNVSAAARQLGVSRGMIYRRLSNAADNVQIAEQ